MTDRYETRPVAFLDTNFMHYIGLYLSFAEGERLYPNDTLEGVNQRDAAMERIQDIGEEDSQASLRRGLAVVFTVVEKNLAIRYGGVSELELLTGRTRGKAILHAANEGLPYRMWSRFPEREIRERLSATDLLEAKEGVEALALLLEKSGVEVESGTHGDDHTTVELAKGLNAMVYIDPLDSLVYSSAILAQADLLFTADTYLKETVNLIHNPKPGSRYETMQCDLKELVAELILGDASEIVLPSAHSVSRKGNFGPSLPSTVGG